MIREIERQDASLAIDCPALVTERLVLRAPHDDDLPELAELANSRRIAEMLSRMPHPYGEAEARAFLASSRRPRAAGCVFAVTLADSGAFIGCAGLNATDAGLELGYWIGERHWGNAMRRRPRMRWSTSPSAPPGSTSCWSPAVCSTGRRGA